MSNVEHNRQQLCSAVLGSPCSIWERICATSGMMISQDGTLVRELPGHEKDVYSTLFHPTGEFLLSGDLAGQVHQWEVATGKLIRKFDAKQLHFYNSGQGVDFGGVRTLTLSPDMQHLACGGLHKATNPLGAVHEPLVLVFEWDSQQLV